MNNLEEFLKAAALAGEFAADILKEKGSKNDDSDILSEKTVERLRVIAGIKGFALDLLTREPPPKSKEIEVRWKDLETAKGWRIQESRQDGMSFIRWDGLCVVASVATEQDDKEWLHVSASWPTRIPTWRELVEIRNLLVGEDTYAVMVIPPKRFYVKIHPYVMHLFICLEGSQLPEFSRGSGTL